MDGSDPFEGDEDAALRYAIALSLQEAGNPSVKKPIELSSDEDEDDLDKGPAYPPIPKETGKESGKASAKDILETTKKPSPPAASGLAALGLDRKKMEEERLARLGKRKALESDQDGQGRRQRPKLDASPEKAVLPYQTSSATQSNDRELPYPKGIVKKTWASGFPREDDITIEEVLQKDQLELAVISSFQWDEDWMLKKIDMTKTRVVLIAFASDETQQEQMKANVPPGRIKFCFPPMLPMGSMHSKLQLLKYPKYLRIVVPSGNFVPYDWGEPGIIENIVFLVDLPRIEDLAMRSANRLNAFGEELCYFLRAQGLEESLVNSLANYDFSGTDRYRFVHSIGASHVGDKWQRTGYCGLGRAVTSLGLNTTADIDIDIVISSLGAINMDLVTAIYFAAQGDNGLKEYARRTSKGNKAKRAADDASAYKDKFRIYFPSHDTVIHSRGGRNAADTICAQAKWWDSAAFPRELVCDCRSVRSGLLLHSKVMMVSHSDSGKSKAAYAYVGSANLSESAWGRLVKEKGTGNPKLTCRNWECGVLVPSLSQETCSGLANFQNTIPIPMKVPGEPYGATQSKRPWLFLEN
ncbi:phospholipase D/nuclease [Xylariaceae sp. FL0662B]|nr:phospholipase D/nuclease [Xylariaceae sp. FL0662B]